MSQEFDTESFIIAVKERPCLWDISGADYANRGMKKEAWEEITQMFGGRDDATPKEKSELCANLQKKWRHLKDSYCREKRRLSCMKSGSAPDRKTPYVYFNILSFLNKASPPTTTQASIAREDIETHPGLETEDDIDSPTGPYQAKVVAKKKKQDDEVGKQLVNVLKQGNEDRKKMDKEFFKDEDKLFMMSLVNDFKKIPEHLKLSAKRQILTVIEEHQRSFSYNQSLQANYHLAPLDTRQASVVTERHLQLNQLQPLHGGIGNQGQNSTPVLSPNEGSCYGYEDSGSSLLSCYQDNSK
ncbi:uncharacterized protein LOC128987091 [Macrosteles quadrilineatus]|uniref:uncharacterized protein LOC128987091 n=1 Tax=Macrosteles quadrilineatus TaxID=74068 RepID=UPI0023E20CA1|nr:uncharacterized protein LOC128987091 [Macrosteles quadrilineatus]